MIWLLLLLLLLVVTGTLWLVVKIALGVALGIFIGFLAIAAIVWWRVRRAMKKARSDGRPPGPSSEVTVLYHED